MPKVTNSPQVGTFLNITQSLAKQRTGAPKSESATKINLSPIQDQVSISRQDDSVAQALTKGMREKPFTNMKDYGAYMVQLFSKLTKGSGQS